MNPVPKAAFEFREDPAALKRAAMPQPVDEQSFELQGLWLKFVDPAVEETFTRETFVRSLVFIRAYLLAGTGLYIAFGFLDALVGGSATHILMAIRYGVVCPILLAIFGLTYFPIFQRFGQPVLCAAMLASGMGVVAMTAIMPAPYNSQYYAGIIMVVMYCGSLIRLKYRYSVMISVFLVASYQVTAILLDPIPESALVSNDFFLVMANLVALFSGYIQELYIRRTYASRKIIELKNDFTSILLREANQANRAKSEFLGNMGHELRTPLNAIIGFSDIIRHGLKGPLNNSFYEEYIVDINNSGMKLLAIVNDVLDYTRAESGKLDLARDIFDLGDLFNDCVENYRSMAEQKGATIALSQSHPVTIVADRRLFSQVILKLLSNAVKFSRSKGEVRISYCDHGASGLTIEIADDGIGIDAKDIDRVLNPFEQVESAYARSNGGAGLGLSFAKKLTELHDGSLSLASALGQGTCITLRLPASRVVRDAAAPVAAAG